MGAELSPETRADRQRLHPGGKLTLSPQQPLIPAAPQLGLGLHDPFFNPS